MNKLTSTIKPILYACCGLLVFASCQQEEVIPLTDSETDVLEEFQASDAISYYATIDGRSGDVSNVTNYIEEAFGQPKEEATSWEMGAGGFYDNSNWGGTNVNFHITVYDIDDYVYTAKIDLGSYGLSKKVSSVVVAPNCHAEFFTSGTATSASYVVKGGTKEGATYISNAGSTHNDRYTHVRFVCSNYDAGLSNKLCGFMYEHSSYGGRPFPIYDNTKQSYVGGTNNDKWSSYYSNIVGPNTCKGVQMYKHSGFSTSYYLKPGETKSSFSSFGWNDAVSGWSTKRTRLPSEWSSYEINEAAFYMNGYITDWYASNPEKFNEGQRKENWGGCTALRTFCDFTITLASIGGSGAVMYYCGGISLDAGFVAAQIAAGVATNNPTTAIAGPATLQQARENAGWMFTSMRDVTLSLNRRRATICGLASIAVGSTISTLGGKLCDYVEDRCNAGWN